MPALKDVPLGGRVVLGANTFYPGACGVVKGIVKEKSVVGGPLLRIRLDRGGTYLAPVALVRLEKLERAPHVNGES